ncbi:MAG: hypothetical protein ACI4EF_11025 [Coprococcus sp.]
MKNNCFKKKVMAYGILLSLLFGVVVPNDSIYAEADDNKYYMGETQKKDDAGYGKDVDMESKDVHSGWELGQFCISGFTRNTTDNDGNVVFLKNVGDTIALTFNLQQDIDELDGNDEYHISEDTNGYDEYFNIPKSKRTNFGYGTLLIKKTDYQNKVTYLQPYTNYLAGVEKGADTEVQFFEEGDYEVALDYEIQNNNFHFWGWRPFDDYTHYQILIKFSVRNGNCMVYPFDLSTKTELINTSFTESGFYIDLANSRYLNIDVKKQNYVESEGTLVEDTRFNKPASDGEEFKDEGVYIITVHNLYTDAETEKKIYVGTDPLLKAYVTTGKDLDYIKELLSDGATIEDDGTITLASNEVIENTKQEDIPEATTKTLENKNIIVESSTGGVMDYLKCIAPIVVIIVISVGFVLLKKKKIIGEIREERDDDDE